MTPGNSPATLSWLRFLYHAGWMTQIGMNVAVIYFVFPAYQRTKNVALLLLGYAYLIGTFCIICDQTIGLNMVRGPEYAAYFTVRRLAYLVDILLGGAGLLLLVKSYLKLKGIQQPDALLPNPAGPGFFTRVWRKLGE